MGWILVPALSGKCEDFIKNNHYLKISKFVYKNGNFIFYREYTNINNGIKHQSADFRICFAHDSNGKEGWCVSYMRHTLKWQDLPIFGSFDYCLNEIKSGRWEVLKPLQ